MTAKIPLPDADYLISLYKSGMTIKAIGERYGCSPNPIGRAMRKEGFNWREYGRTKHRFDIDSLYKAHQSGESILSISNRTGASRIAINRWFADAGYTWRNPSEAQNARYIGKSESYKKRIALKAQEARRGQIDSDEVKNSRAKSFHKAKIRVGRYEREILEELTNRGIPCSLQNPIGNYNIDIFIHEPAIAVEVYSSHPCRKRMSQIHHRTEYILNSGISQITIQCRYPERVFILSDVCDKIISFRDFCSRNKSSVGHNGVIRGDGKIAATSSHYLNDFTAVMSF